MKKLILALISGLLTTAAISSTQIWVASSSFQDGKTAFEAKQYTQAYNIWIKLAEDGSHMAQSNIGALYATGQGVSQDFTKAEMWMEKAALQGDEKAKFNLDLMRKSQK